MSKEIIKEIKSLLNEQTMQIKETKKEIENTLQEKQHNIHDEIKNKISLWKRFTQKNTNQLNTILTQLNQKMKIYF